LPATKTRIGSSDATVGRSSREAIDHGTTASGSDCGRRDGVEAIRLARGADVDVAILDVSMPRMTGLHAAGELFAVRPEIGVLILSMHDNTEYLFEALRAGASGYC
jgi:DNA-binding NarL/FixJ family response regulator